MKGRAGIIAAVAAAIAAIVWSKRPVKPPPSQGSWTPADSARSRN